jgi:hypothetical protein
MGITNFDVVAANAFIGAPFPTGGNVYFVAPVTGSDGNSGKSPRKPFKTLLKAQTVATANQNDVVFFLSEGNAAALATDYQSATLDWAKDGVHLIGINSGSYISQRSRVAFVSTYVTASNLFTVSADNCYIAGIQFWAGVASANPTGCVKVTGERNKFKNCQFGGMGATLMDSAGAYSLKLEGGGENFFEDCIIGQDTSAVGAAVNAHLYFASATARNKFKGCTFLMYTAHATNTQFIRAAAASMLNIQVFDECIFINDTANGSTTLTQAATIVAGGSPAGGVLLRQCVSVGATDWNATDAGNVYGSAESATANAIGLGVTITR